MEGQVPPEVRLMMAEAALAGERAAEQRLWRELYDMMGVPPMQESNAELIFGIRMTLDRLRNRIAELEGTATDGTAGA
ncbi:hypothetical protein [Rhodococcus triatomae]